MKTFDANYRLLEEMYQDEYYPDFLVDKVKTELQKVIALLEEGETDTNLYRKSWTKAFVPSMLCKKNLKSMTAKLKP